MDSPPFPCFAPVLYRWRTQALQQALDRGVDPVGVDWLLGEVAGVDRLQLRLLPQETDRPLLLQCDLEQIDRLWQKHLDDRIPLQYLAGFTHWRTFKLQVSSDVLIPRPETELLIDWVENWAKHTPQAPQQWGHWADLGTGSGAIALGLATVLPQATIHAVDCSAPALDLARRNAQAYDLASHIQWHLGFWLDPLTPWRGQWSGLVSNPPYIPSATVLQLQPEVQHHEPHLALDGGEDGLRDLDYLIRHGAEYLQPGGVLVLEMMAGQGEAVRSRLQAQDCYEKIQICKDLAGLDRFAVAFRQ